MRATQLFRGKRTTALGVVLLLLTALLTWNSARTSAPTLVSRGTYSPRTANQQQLVRCCANDVQSNEIDVAAEESADPAFAAFDAWVAAFDEVAATDERQIESGISLAQKRTAALQELIVTNPKLALQRAVPPAVRARLPQKINGSLEKRIRAHGSYNVIISTMTDGSANITRTATIEGTTYRAFVYGRRMEQTSKLDLPLHGIAIGSDMAVAESPVRLLEPDEKPDPRAKIGNLNGACPVSGDVASREIIAESGDTVFYLCSGGHIHQLEESLIAAEGGTAPDAGGGAIAQSAWTTGNKTVLFIRVNYPDDLTDPQSEASSASMMTACSNFMLENSYGVTSMTTTVTPLFTLPKTKAEYVTLGDGTLYSDARAAATAAGYNYTSYTLDCVRFQGGPGSYGGQAYVGSRGCWLKSSSAGVAAHEFGHNFGLWHANYWNVTSENPIGAGSNQEYGDSFDTMGSASAGAYHYNAYEKNRLDWLPTANVTTVTASGTYRITTYDQAVLAGGTIYALKVKKDSDRDYWLDFRQKFTSNKWLMSGVDLHWDPWTSSNAGSQLIDTTPGSVDGKNDAAIVIGRTFSDAAANIHITPIGKGGTAPESLDVVVNVGTFPGNVAPVIALNASTTTVATGGNVNFSATASDSNGDALAYYWDFGDRNFGTNSATAAKSWTVAGEYVVRCTVSDMKGGVASDSVIVTVGAPATYRISGQITSGGQPLEGARVSVSSTYQTYADSDGTYTIANLPAGSYTVSAAKPGYTFTASGFTNPVTAPASAINFVGALQTWSISGTITESGTPVSGVTVSDGTRSATTNTSGAYTLASVPNGSYTLTAAKSGYTFIASGWTNPVAVTDNNVTGRNFVTPVYSISGEVTGLAQSVSVSDGVRSANTFKQGASWLYTLSGVPAGTWNLRATLSGAIIAPSNFSNPVTITTANRSNCNFSGSTGTAYSISGTITSFGAPLSGAIVSDGTRSSTSDSLGKYFIANVPNGSYTLTPNKSGYNFTPVSLAVTVSGVALTGKDFSAGGNNAPVANNQSVGTNEDTAKAIVLTGSDADGNALAFSIVANPAHGTLSGTGVNRTYTPAANYNGADSFTFKVNDGFVDSNTATIAITVTAVNDAPVANNQSVSTPKNTAKAVTLTASDIEGNALTYVIVAPPAHGILSGSGAGQTYTPAANYTGPDSFTFKANDGAADSNVATVSITVTIANSAPVANNQSVTTAEDTAKAVTLTGSDGDGDSLSYIIVTNPAHGTLSGTGATRTYTPTSNYNGADSFTFKVNDGTIDSNVATISLTITAINDAPVASSQAVSTLKRTPVAIALQATDVDSTTLAYSILTGPARGTLAGTPPNLTYTPANKFSGTDSFTFTASDGAAASNTATVTINVTRTAPQLASALTAVPNPALVGEIVSFPGVATDPDGDTLKYSWDFGDGGSSTDQPAAHGYTVAGSYTAMLTVSDEDGQTIVQSITVSVNANGGGGGSGGGTAPGIDSDGDGVSDADEIIAGTDPADPHSVPKLPLQVSKFAAKLNFAALNEDSCALSGYLPDMPAGFQWSGATVLVNIGGMTQEFKLDQKGKARTGYHGLALKAKMRRNGANGQAEFSGGNIAFTLQMKRTDLQTPWSEKGIDRQVSIVQSMEMPVEFMLGGRIYATTVHASYASKEFVGAKIKR